MSRLVWYQVAAGGRPAVFCTAAGLPAAVRELAAAGRVQVVAVGSPKADLSAPVKAGRSAAGGAAAPAVNCWRVRVGGRTLAQFGSKVEADNYVRTSPVAWYFSPEFINVEEVPTVRVQAFAEGQTGSPTNSTPPEGAVVGRH